MISVIMPTYKISRNMLERAIESVMSQTYRDWELIVVDDNMPDSEWRKVVVDSFKKHEKDNSIRFLFHAANKGANAARNTGIQNSQGDIVAFLDSDDEWEDSYLEEIEKRFENPDVGIVACDLIRVFPDRKVKSSKTHEDGYIYDELIYGDIVGPTSAVSVRKKVIIDAGLFDENLPARQDYDMWLRVCKISEISYVRKPLVKLHCDNHTRISTGNNNHINGTLMVIDKLMAIPELSDKASKIKYSHLKYLGIRCLQENDYILAKKYLKQALSYKYSGKVVGYYIMASFPCIWTVARWTRRKIKARIEK